MFLLHSSSIKRQITTFQIQSAQIKIMGYKDIKKEDIQVKEMCNSFYKLLMKNL